MSNYCIYDCAYCINRRSNDRPRATLTVKELVDLTIGFYRRNYIEGLFLSSGVVKNADYTMERMMLVAKQLRIQENFNGYIHLKAIPGASQKLIYEAGIYADRLSINLEIPTNLELERLAPEKNHKQIMEPMGQIKNQIISAKEERRKFRNAPRFSPAGQSTQLIVGATPETDQTILKLATGLYDHQNLKRVYYSGYLPVNDYDKRLPSLTTPPLVRENRLYQSDWLMRFYHFKASEIVDDKHPFLDLEIDPKLAYALRNRQLYPINVNTADYEMILRIPGIGVRSAQKIIEARKFRMLTSHHLKKIGVVLKRAKYFITNTELPAAFHDLSGELLRSQIIQEKTIKHKQINYNQLSLFPELNAVPNSLIPQISLR